jgi:hypothetical protein
MSTEDDAVRRREAANDDSSDRTERDSNAKNGEAGDGSDQEKQNEGPATWVHLGYLLSKHPS